MGFNWDEECISLATTELDRVLETGKKLVPTLTTDVIRRKNHRHRAGVLAARRLSRRRRNDPAARQ